MYAYLRLFRWPNLLVVALTQFLIRYAIILPILQVHEIEPALSHFSFFILVLATLLITAAGYAINDYFDLRTDRINKPEKIVLGKSISRRTAILYHSLFNFVGVLMGIYLSWVTGHWPLILIFLFIPIILWMYSIRYKRKFLIGNFIVAVMSAFVVSIVWIFEFQSFDGQLDASHVAAESITFLVRAYAFFAFLTTLLREIIKDVEDIRGDAKTGCKTLPIIAGIRTTHRIMIFLIIGIIALIFYLQLFLLKKEFDLLFAYIIVAIQLPLIFLIHKINTAAEKSDYHNLSLFAKYIMISGVLTTVIFYFYTQAGFSIL